MTSLTKNVFVVDHAVVRDSLRYLRDQKTPLDEFRLYSARVCQYLFAEAVKDLPLNKVKIQTPLATTEAEVMNGGVVVIPILRAGVAMLAGAMQALPQAKIGFVGLKRDEATAEANQYYWNVPHMPVGSTVIITDPMLATGGTIWHVLDRLRGEQASTFKVVCVVAAPEGIKRIHQDFPEVKIYTAAVDDKLNAQKYIVPGLGDYGDRYCGTEE